MGLPRAIRTAPLRAGMSLLELTPEYLRARSQGRLCPCLMPPGSRVPAPAA